MPKNNLEFEKKRIYKQGFCKIDEGFVKSCDAHFEERLSGAVKEFMAKSGSRVIGLTGPTCSGKTTAAKKLIEYLGDEKKRGRKAYSVRKTDRRAAKLQKSKRCGNARRGRRKRRLSGAI